MRIRIKLLTLLLALMMLLQASAVTIFAFEPIYVDTSIHYAFTGYDETSDVKYVKDGKYIANWGAREEDCTFLSPNAVSFYKGDDVYEVVSKLSGGSTESAAGNSALYKELQSIMKSAQTYETSYNATRDLFKYTDCQNSNYSSKGAISSFYSGKGIGPSWDGGGTWNREHTWPNSKGDNSGNGENDIMMLRPTATSENGSRGNTAYGEGSSYYNPNSESGNKYDLRGDVARIVLYTYVRWNCKNTGSYNPNGITGTGGVIQSIDILLKWIEQDPVDTWEMGRNDSVQSITGTRNVFVDYPEYAFLLFGRTVPSGMTTPSSGSHNWNSGTVTKQPTCTTAGEKLYTCTDSGCGKTKTESIPALGHSWNGGAITLDPTCTDKGVKTYICLTCSSSKTENIAAKGHTYGAWIIDTEATETTTGSKHRVCATCNNTETATIPVIGHNHSYTSVVTKPTCTSQGYTTHSCECGDTVIDSYTSTIPHNYKNGYCVECGASDSSAPVYTVSDFRNAISGLYIGLTGEDLYNTIRNSVVIYNSLSDADKASVAPQYNSLKQAIAEYNASANELNADIDKVNHSLFGDQTMSTAVIFFAVYTLLNKKYV